MNGKGSKLRPLTILYDEYVLNWDNIFKKNNTLQTKESTSKAVINKLELVNVNKINNKHKE